ncbi:ABC transporter ATP-binding protein [Cellulomonas sp. ES6]|uniref:ABC transporter ATP-binding protein n=1 Tax=Cellulomonas sp. ES6 TaxID=3039384 RepID=UPI0024B7E7C4|nr:ABC transporter ATP-binding protein [Cellulomonas sp. ES6]WHP17271.1 ABC transporter ATP-binding protein [Cellulomonas sp. ES6]
MSAPDPAPGPAGPSAAGTVALPVATGRRTWQVARRLLRPHRRRLALAGAVLLVAAAAGLAVPALLGVVVQVATDRGPLAAVAWAAAGIAVASLASATLGAVGAAALARVSEHALAELREQVVDRALHLPAADVETAGQGDVVSRVSGDVEAVGEAATGVLPAVASALFAVGVTLAGLGALDWRFAAGALAAVPLQVWSTRRFRRRTPAVYAAARAAEAVRAEALLQTVQGAPTALALREADRHLEAVAATSRTAIATEMRGVGHVGRFANGLNLAEACGLVGVLAAGYLLVASGAAGVGAATAAALFFHRLFGPMGVLLFQVDELARAGAGLARLAGVADLPRQRSGRPVAERSGPPPVTVEAAGFAYHPGRPVLDGVSLRVAPGEHVALVGPSGAGKSTLARLVTGTLDPTSGRARVGADDAALVHHERPGCVVLVDQDVHVFAGTLADDLRLAAPRAADADLVRALEAVGAAWWSELPDGLATVLGPDGADLPPDRAQQVALARVLLADPAVVVLDEATADLPRTRRDALDAALDAVLGGRTAVVVAHRLDQAVRADRVVVLAGGRVVQQGPPAALLATAGPFRTAWDAWSGRTVPGAPGPGATPRPGRSSRPRP